MSDQGRQGVDFFTAPTPVSMPAVLPPTDTPPLTFLEKLFQAVYPSLPIPPAIDEEFVLNEIRNLSSLVRRKMAEAGSAKMKLGDVVRIIRDRPCGRPEHNGQEYEFVIRLTEIERAAILDSAK